MPKRITGIDLLAIDIHPSSKRIAIIKVKYHHLILRCEVVLSNKKNYIWIRMPETRPEKRQKRSYAMWEEKEVSDYFQEKIIKQLKDKFDFDLNTAISLEEKRAKTLKKETQVA